MSNSIVRLAMRIDFENCASIRLSKCVGLLVKNQPMADAAHNKGGTGSLIDNTKSYYSDRSTFAGFALAPRKI